jgi:hypothetical protein
MFAADIEVRAQRLLRASSASIFCALSPTQCTGVWALAWGRSRVSNTAASAALQNWCISNRLSFQARRLAMCEFKGVTPIRLRSAPVS